MDKRKTKCVTFSYKGKRQYCYGRTLSEAYEKMFNRKLLIKKTGGNINDSRLSLDSYFIEWEAQRRGTIKPSTELTVKKHYKRLSACFTENTGTAFGKTRLKDLNRDMVLTLRETLLSEMSSSSVNNAVSLLRRVLEDAVTEGLIDNNPCSSIKPVKRMEPPARETIHRALSRKETKLFFRHAKGTWYYDLYRFLLNSGMRCGEAGALKVSDLKKDIIEVRRTITRTTAGYTLGEDTKTGAGRRDIPYTAGLMEICERQININRERFGIDNNTKDNDELLFHSPKGKLLIPSNVDIDIKKICIKAGLEPFTAHAFRDTFATRAIESGMNPKTLQEILGHSSYSITMDLYAHVMPSTKAKEMERIRINI